VSLVIAFVALPIGIVASQAAFADNTAEPSTSDGSRAVESSPENPFPVTPDGWAVDTNAVYEAATPLSECPEALVFLTSPEVHEFQTKHFGDPYTRDSRFLNGCPDVDAMRTQYEAARMRILSGEK